MAEARWSYWGRFTALAAASLGVLFFLIVGFLPQRFLLELGFSESGFAYPVIRPPLAVPRAPATAPPQGPIPRGPAERFWAEYLPLARAGEEAAALALIEEYLAANPEDLSAALERARALWRAGALAAATDAYESALGRGADPAAKLELARLHVAARRWRAALAVYAELAAVRRDDVTLLREYAEAATWAEDYARAEALYARLAELEPGDLELRIARARVLYWAGVAERAAQVLDGLPAAFAGAGADSLRRAIAAALPPAASAAYDPLQAARALAMAGAVDSALALYRMLAAEQPDADSLRLEIAGVFEYRANAPDSAVRYLDSYLARRPDDHAARLRLARLHAWSGRIGEAEAAVQAVLERRPADAEAWALLGDLHRWRGESERAEAAYRRALALDPEVGGAAEGLAALDAQLDAELAARGSAGPGGTLDYFADSDGFRMARWRGGYRLGTPRQRWGVEVGVEHLAGHDRDGQRGELEAVEATALAERWWSYGRLSGQAALGVWIAGSDLVEPLLVLALSTPDWGNAAYRIEYRHEPGYRQTSTYEAAAADLRADVLGFEYYRPLGPRWEASAGARLAHFSGLDATNLRGDVSLAFLYAAGDGWLVGYESRGLGFSDAAPRAARPLYWDPEWYWLNAALARWTARRDGLEIMAQGSAGVAWMREREMDSEMAAQFALALDVRRRLGDWTLVGRAALSQSRADGYRAFRFDLGLSRGFAR